MDLYAWIGEDELGSGRVGIKTALTGDGTPVALAAMADDRGKLEQFTGGLQRQADRYGKTIRLVRFAPQEAVITVTPRPQG